MDSAAGGSSRAVGRSNVDAFVATLSPWDLLYLRGRFRGGTLPITGLAGLPDLPAEIVSLIAVQLTLDDIVNCRLVSRDWHASWTQSAVITALSHFFFPGLVEKHEQLKVPQSPRRLVDASVTRALRRRHARPCRASFIVWRERCCPVFRRPREEDDQGSDCRRTSYRSTGPPVFYDRARLAWQASEVSVIVDDLRTCRRHDCSLVEAHVQGQRLALQAMSRELLVFVARRPSAGLNYNTVQIWHVDLEEWRRTTLPGPLATCFVEGERAAFITRQGLVIAWSWTGGATEVDVSGEVSRPPEDYEGRQSLPGVMLHPERLDTLYVAAMFRSKLSTDGFRATGQSQQRRFLMSVVRYQGGKPTKRWQELIRKDSLSITYDDSTCKPFRITLACSKMGSHGLHNLGTVLTASNKNHPTRVVELATAAFSIYKETFIQRTFAESEGSSMTDRSPLHFEPSAWGVCEYEEPLTTWSQQHASIPRWVKPDSADGPPDRDEAAADDVFLYLKELAKGVPASEPCRIFGDEDFEIHVTTQGILVWSFTEETNLPAVDGPRSLGETKDEPWKLADPVRGVDLHPFAG
ncbi:F-box domain, Skp2-like protein [Metarhizium album ARSEF 1941]|uniref:F-box domain, Skp2-like protein n=1 Tax=Metarhizium album (strain ARSEF 1941) TaxID=1081103 RepID=A0A0B2WMR7_METAS|nr:F-box domain, Skp2-like protein [Metarhizium album ARSEF 1941]KHN94762.1 F-box domain, Skp2-like protein [Metarhizium album ARSEF 1941]